ncbi:MAG: PAS domain S-box protein, partial [Victivallales bacterium]|nr:PAS domain S-box protein [Victivallales bacterium]
MGVKGKKGSGEVGGRAAELVLKSLDSIPEGVMILSTDIGDTRKALGRETHLNKVLKGIRNVNQLITHEKDRDTLLRRSCEVLTETRGYRSAWIGLRLPDGSLRAAGESGIGEGSQPLQAQLVRGELPECCKKALGGADIVVMHDTNINCVRCPLAKTYRNTAALSSLLQHADRDYGFLVVALPADLADDVEEQSLFRELAGDVAYALYVMDTEAVHARNEQTLQAVFEFASDGILLADADSGRFVLGNRAISRMLGYSAEEILELFVNDIHPTEAFDSVRAQFDKQVLGEITLAEDIPIKRKDGTVFLADVNSAVFEIDGCRYLAGIFRDITERKKAEAALAKSEEHHRVLFDQSRDPMMTLAPPSWRFTSGNPAAMKLFGVRDLDEFLTLGPWDVSPEFQPDGRLSSEKAREMTETARREGSHFFEWTHRRLDGELILSTVLLNSVGVGGETFLQATVRDITALKLAESDRDSLQAQLFQAQKM